MSPLTSPSTTFPIALYEKDKVTVYPPKEVYTGALANSDVHFSYIRKPADVVWAYGVDQTTGAYIWDGSPGFSLSPIIGGASVNFEIDESQQTEVIIGILKYAGVVVRDPQIIGVANQIEQQEEVNSKR